MHTTENAIRADQKQKEHRKWDNHTYIQYTTSCVWVSFFLSAARINSQFLSAKKRTTANRTKELCLAALLCKQANVRGDDDTILCFFICRHAELATDIDRFMPRSNDDNLSPTSRHIFILSLPRNGMRYVCCDKQRTKHIICRYFFFSLWKRKK